jgi:hypothetical protein
MRDRPCLWCCLCSLALGLLACQARAVSVTFDDIIVTVKSEPRGQVEHGYSEHVFTLTNRSTDRGHTVTLAIPQEASGAGYGDYLRSVNRTVRVEPRTTLQVALLHPAFPPLGGSGARVIIDGREQAGGVPVGVPSGPVAMGHYGRFRMPRAYYSALRALDGTHLPVLASQRVGREVDVVNQLGGIAMRHLRGDSTGEVVRSEEPVASWSPRWLSYSRYDAVVLTRDELEGLGRGPADSQAVRTALFQYVEAGGVLLVLDPGPLALPASWQRRQESRNGVQIAPGGFGLCFQIDRGALDNEQEGAWSDIRQAWYQTGVPYRSERSVMDANRALPIVEDLGLPLGELFLLLLVFTLVIGPCNILLLARWKRRIWLLWTVPLISLLTCTAVFGYMVIVEGWQGRARVTAFTLLDEAEQRATTLGRSACYSPLTPGDGLHFGQDTLVTVQGADASDTSTACDLDWTRDQHLVRGWVSARVPAHFQLCRCEVKRLERLPVTREADGSLHVTNQLGAAIRSLWLADDKGHIHTASGVGAGQRAALTLTNKTVNADNGREVHRRLYVNTEWAGLGALATGKPGDYLLPRTYLAVLESSPFLGPGLAGAVVRPTDSYVLGLMAEE